MSNYTLAWKSIDNATDPDIPNKPEGAIQVTGFTGDYEKYNGIYLQKENSGYDPDYGYPYFYEHKDGTCKLSWNVGFSYWYFMSIQDYQEFACSEGGIVGDTPKHPSNYSYIVNAGINSGNPVVHA